MREARSGDKARMKSPGVYLATAFIVAFSVLLFLPVWAAYGVLIPESGGHHSGVMVKPQEFRATTQEFVEKYKLEDGSVQPEPGDVYLMAMQYAWVPNTIRLQTGEEYTFHVSSVDVMHGFSLQMGDQSYNATVMPGQVSRVEMTPTQPGIYFIACNEYCGAGHEFMSARFIVEGEPVSAEELEHEAEEQHEE